jgi:hypothetical protein
MKMIMKWMNAACWCEEEFYGSGRAHERDDSGKAHRNRSDSAVAGASRPKFTFSSVLLLPQSLTRVCRGVSGTQSALGVAREVKTIAGEPAKTGDEEIGPAVEEAVRDVPFSHKSRAPGCCLDV